MQLVVQAAQEVLHAQGLAGTKSTSINVQYVRIFRNNMVGNKRKKGINNKRFGIALNMYML